MLAAKVTITLETCHAVDALQEALNRHGTPEIVNTDQGSQFTSAEFVQEAEDRGCRESMDVSVKPTASVAEESGMS